MAHPVVVIVKRDSGWFVESGDGFHGPFESQYDALRTALESPAYSVASLACSADVRLLGSDRAIPLCTLVSPARSFSFDFIIVALIFFSVATFLVALW